MDDLSGLNWTPAQSQDANKKPVMNNSSSVFSTLRPTPPLSGRSTPLSGQPSGGGLAPHHSNPPSKPATPANDSFSNLVPFGGTSSNKNLSLAEQQKRLAEQKAQQENARREAVASQYEVKDPQFWDNLGSGRSTPAISTAPPTQSTLTGHQSQLKKVSSPSEQEDEDDILAAFNASAPVDKSTHFPAPELSKLTSPKPIPTSNKSTDASNTLGDLMGDDEDPFGLQQMSRSKPPPSQPQPNEDDDFLGLLGKPVSELPPPVSVVTPIQDSDELDEGVPTSADPRDRAIAELVDMGFPADKARQALLETESGTDVQAAVGWLLHQAHAESRQKSRARGIPDRSRGADEIERQTSRRPERAPRRRTQDDANTPAWMTSDREKASTSERTDSRPPTNGEKDPAQIASELGSNLVSFWKAGAKKMQQAVHDFNSDSDSTQPRWMRDPMAGDTRAPKQQHPFPDEKGSRRRRGSETQQDSSNAHREPAEITDEAMMLESGNRPPPRRQTQDRREAHFARDVNSSRDSSPSMTSRAVPMSAPTPLQMRHEKQPAVDPKSRLNRQAAEEQSAQAYVSPARRRKAAPTPRVANAGSEPMFDSSSAPKKPLRPSTASPPSQATRPAKPPTATSVRPKPAPRHIPTVNPSALSQSHSHRQKGTEAYKRGDYGAAHSSYTSALSSLPDKHPIAIIILSNRAMTGLKIGEPKTAVADADSAMVLIGPSKGELEAIDLQNGEQPKEMKEFYGKALMRKAEALEQMERWEDAAKVWREAVELGHGGGTSIAGRNRCEKAGGINQPAKQAAPGKPPPKKGPSPKTSAIDALSGKPTLSAAPSAAAVTRLREANAKAEKVDDEKFALADTVDAKITAWKGGKQDNLRALICSLDTVLWPEAGWKKVGMSELVLPNKVKIAYMKGIAKVHPDKIPTNATTEQRMISGAVFSTLNEAWDKFKKDNNL